MIAVLMNVMIFVVILVMITVTIIVNYECRLRQRQRHQKQRHCHHYRHNHPPLEPVYAIRGQEVRLPCDITSPKTDSVLLVLWYKNGTKTPVYSIDSRASNNGKSLTWSSAAVFGSRASWHPNGKASELVVKGADYKDQGEYRCRVDFQKTPTHNANVQLHVVGEYQHSSLSQVDKHPLPDFTSLSATEWSKHNHFLSQV
ncbi:uncharacterized protein LOC143039786 [Oratosquilla oratoria]|uniref:uncharacterized protein LOC143039786 n=1 Tax=Oratosquilla oratoria TaxID=337810 RepID=UPI003F773E2A